MIGKTVLLLGFLGIAFVISISIYQWETSKQRRAQAISQLQEPRKQLIRETCNQNEMYSEGKSSWDDVSYFDLEHLVVDDNHGIIYCFVPKVACTNWKRVMFVLSKNKTEPYGDPTSVPPGWIHYTDELPMLKRFPKAEWKARLKHYTKFLFVRDPFVRLISAFRDKFQQRNNLVYRRTGQHILRKFGNVSNPPQTVDEAFDSGVHVSFPNFIRFLVDPETEKGEPFEQHWRQMYRLCHPCLIEYDFIGYQETLQEDAQQLLTILNLDEDIKFPASYENVTTAEYLTGWYGAVPLEDRRKLYKIYEPDFKLFNYPKPHKLLEG